MFKTDGSVHHGGVKNETDTIGILNQLKIYKKTVEARGGTTQKADAVSGGKALSIKRKVGIANGSFDWFNTSKYNSVFCDAFSDFCASMVELRRLPFSIVGDGEFVEMVRNRFNQLCERCLDTLTEDQITEILQKGFVEPNEGFDIVINDVKLKRLFVFEFESHPVVEYLARGFQPHLEGNGASSRKIVFTNGTQSYDSGLRLRVTSNNGINAFLGLSKANKNSQVVVKLQQDKVNHLISQICPKTYDY
jgi:hypothetical protein